MQQRLTTVRLIQQLVLFQHSFNSTIVCSSSFFLRKFCWLNFSFCVTFSWCRLDKTNRFPNSIDLHPLADIRVSLDISQSGVQLSHIWISDEEMFKFHQMSFQFMPTHFIATSIHSYAIGLFISVTPKIFLLVSFILNVTETTFKGMKMKRNVLTRILMKNVYE